MALVEAILAVVEQQPLHAYAIRQALLDRIGAFRPVSPAQVSGSLGRLAHRGEVRAIGGPGPTRYALTRAGRSRLSAWRNRPPTPRPEGFDDWFAQVAVAHASGDASATRRLLRAHRGRCILLRRDLEGRDRDDVEIRAALSLVDAEIEWLETLTVESGVRDRTE